MVCTRLTDGRETLRLPSEKLARSYEKLAMTDEYLSVVEAGKSLGRRKGTVFKIMKRLGIVALKRRDSDSRNQVASFISRDDFNRVVEELKVSDIGEGSESEDDGGDGFISAEIGVFYLIRLEPECDPLRFKVGFAANLKDRLRALRCSAPFASVVQSWPCRRLWEKTAIDCVTTGCQQLHTEVFRCLSIEEVKDKCDKFFGLMPSVTPPPA